MMQTVINFVGLDLWWALLGALLVFVLMIWWGIRNADKPAREKQREELRQAEREQLQLMKEVIIKGPALKSQPRREVIHMNIDPPCSLQEVKAAIHSYMLDEHGPRLRRLTGINEIQACANRAHQSLLQEISGDDPT